MIKLYQKFEYHVISFIPINPMQAKIMKAIPTIIKNLKTSFIMKATIFRIGPKTQVVTSENKDLSH